MYTIKYKTKVKVGSVMGEEDSDYEYIDYKMNNDEPQTPQYVINEWLKQ